MRGHLIIDYRMSKNKVSCSDCDWQTVAIRSVETAKDLSFVIIWELGDFGFDISSLLVEWSDYFYWSHDN